MISRIFGTALRVFHLLLRPALYTLLGGFVAVVIIGILFLNHKPDLRIWHTAFLDAEFTASSDIDSFSDYLKLEDRLFQELDDQVYDKVPDSEKTAVNRYNKGGKSDPSARAQNWNRTFELVTDNPKFGVLLLHGLSDSPYSVRTLAQQMHKDGAHAIGLRIPGHGTAPSGLRRTTFEDMAAAVELAMKHLKSEMADMPIFIVGYSNGGALAVHYANNSITDASLPAAAGLILLSPEIGIAPAAALASTQAWIGERLGLKKLAWNSVGIEFDPYKYNSFALNAGVLAYNATQLLQSQIKSLVESGQIKDMPAILAFQSAADATVDASVLMGELFDNLNTGDHQLVVFDVNRVYDSQGLLVEPFDINTIISGPPRPYDVSVITNKTPSTLKTVLYERPAGEQKKTTKDLDVSWPLDVYSLAHIALPFPPDDPLYGSGDNGSDNKHVIRLGSLAVHGERKTLSIPISALTRQHWNPFFSVITDKTRAFVEAHMP